MTTAKEINEKNHKNELLPPTLSLRGGRFLDEHVKTQSLSQRTHLRDSRVSPLAYR